MKTSELKTFFILVLLGILTIGYLQVVPRSRSQVGCSEAETYQINPQIEEFPTIQVTIQVTSPNGYNITGNTPIIVKLNKIANELPTSVDPFGLNTTDTQDDINWSTTYVTYNDSLIPSQVDDVDGQTGFTNEDELVFQIPETEEIKGGESLNFEVYLTTYKDDFPEPSFPEICTIYDYPKLDEVNEIHGTWTLREASYIENEIIQACALVDAEWSSGGLYELSILDEYGNSSWDTIKQKYQMDWFIWKWSRFALVEQFIEQNQYNPFLLQHIITGPVRAQIQMQSVASYGDQSSVWGDKPGVYALVTYDVFAHLPYLDYTLDITGPNATDYPTLIMNYQNREWGGRPGSPYKSIYVPGQDWLLRNPIDIEDHKVEKADFSETWYLEGLDEGQEITPPSFAEPDDDQLGYGFIFDDIGFTNITWDAASEYIASWYDACQFPFHTRYYPFDASILKGQDRISYMEDRYQEWTRPVPTLKISAPPKVTIDSPLAQTYTTDTITVTLSGEATHYWYYIESIDNKNRTWTASMDRTLADGIYTLHAYGNNSVGNIAHDSVMFTIETAVSTTTTPTMTITTEANPG